MSTSTKAIHGLTRWWGSSFLSDQESQIGLTGRIEPAVASGAEELITMNSVEVRDKLLALISRVRLCGPLFRSRMRMVPRACVIQCCG